ncbi:MAG: exopolyphosphatase/guanosine-5'-triphosphate,3'-diphosphate pyrophosphatase [Patiriisocius sp.]|jgi:exopolyphosphatase/guanosine-5'-triphosphate,3'-diphosphate pyrophosphatase
MEDISNERFGAIDIGTNAVRLVIKELRVNDEGNHWYKLCYTRVPIRLGEDVFTSGYISDKKMNDLALTFKAFKYLMKAMEVKDYRACSTSAMREAKNATLVQSYIQEEADIKIEILSGKEEAELIIENFKTQKLDPKGHYFFIDVGGGSTEISLIYENERMMSRSFDLGTVRALSGQDSTVQWNEMKEFAQTVKSKYKELIGIGTGGNINKLFKESGHKTNEMMTLRDIIQVKEYFSTFTYDQRINMLKMRPDRADVIIPAAEIFIHVMENAGVEKMIVPKIGLSDGIILDLFQRNNS